MAGDVGRAESNASRVCADDEGQKAHPSVQEPRIVSRAFPADEPAGEGWEAAAEHCDESHVLPATRNVPSAINSYESNGAKRERQQERMEGVETQPVDHERCKRRKNAARNARNKDEEGVGPEVEVPQSLPHLGLFEATLKNTGVVLLETSENDGSFMVTKPLSAYGIV